MWCLRQLYENRELTLAMGVRELRSVYRGSVLGAVWLLLSPLIRVAIYVFVVAIVFKQGRDTEGGTLGYALYVLSGIIPWQLLTRSIEDAPSLIRDRVEIVRNVVYPIETLPIISLISQGTSLLGALFIYLVVAAAAGRLHISLLLLPIPVIMLSLFSVGTAWILSLIGLAIRDVRELVSIVLGLLVYISPVVISERMAGDTLWMLVMANPLSHPIICFRDVLDGTWHMGSWITMTVMTAISLTLGSLLMARAKPYMYEYL